MTTRLYWQDQAKLSFDAKILQATPTADGRLAVLLDGTYFYPEGGGQPADHGAFGALGVTDVQKDGNDIVHFVADTAAARDLLQAGNTVPATIAADRRLQHTRAHSAGHMLYGAARKLFAGLGYAGFDIHGGGGSLYLNTDAPITPNGLLRMLELANQAVIDQRPITTRIVAADDVAAIDDVVFNVKLPEGDIRIVTVEGWDVAVCSGTHVANSIEIGPIAVTSRKPHKKGVTRIEYVVGQAAIQHLANTERIVNDISGMLSSGRDEIVSTVQKSLQAAAAESKARRKLQAELGGYQLDAMLAKGTVVGQTTLIVGSVPGMDQKALMGVLNKQLKARTQTLIGLVGDAGKPFMIVGTTPDTGLDLRETVSGIAKQHGGGGGGSATLVSAGGLKSTPETVLPDLENALTNLCNGG